MTGTLVFVHGTGGREPEYGKVVARIKEQAGKFLPGVSVTSVPWGPSLRTDYPEILREVFPLDVETRALDELPVDEEIARWLALRDDPLVELRLAALATGGAGGTPAAVAIGGPPPGQQLANAVREVRGSPPETSGVSEEELRRAAEVVANAPELQEAAATASDAQAAELRELAARATVAVIIRSHAGDAPGTEPAAVLLAEERDRLVEWVAGQLQVDARFVGDFFKKIFLRVATGRARAHRYPLTVMGVNFWSDILHYVRRGEAIRDLIRKTIDGAERPVVVLAHSLGGIACVDLLSEENPPSIDLFVTAGSQSPVLFAMDALETLRPPKLNALPARRWMNFFDPNDLIAFRAGAVFHDADHVVEDINLPSGQPFPVSHGAYFVNPAFWERIAQEWPQR